MSLYSPASVSKKQWSADVHPCLTEDEKKEYRSCAGSLQWLGGETPARRMLIGVLATFLFTQAQRPKRAPGPLRLPPGSQGNCRHRLKGASGQRYAPHRLWRQLLGKCARSQEPDGHLHFHFSRLFGSHRVGDHHGLGQELSGDEVDVGNLLPAELLYTIRHGRRPV